MSIVLSQSGYGKSEIRLVKVSRRARGHDLRDVTVDVGLEGDFDAAYIAGDNTGLLATDTMRNTVYALAKQYPIDPIESFGRRLIEHFLAAGPGVTRARVHIVEHPWARLRSGGVPTSTRSSAGAVATASRPWSATAASHRSKPGSRTCSYSRPPGRAGRGSCAIATRRSPRRPTGSWRRSSPRDGHTGEETSSSERHGAGCAGRSSRPSATTTARPSSSPSITWARPFSVRTPTYGGSTSPCPTSTTSCTTWSVSGSERQRDLPRHQRALWAHRGTVERSSG